MNFFLTATVNPLLSHPSQISPTPPPLTPHPLFINNGPVSLFKTIFSHQNCFLSSVAMDGKDGRGLKPEKFKPSFSS